ncbi:MAG: Type 1 glutamine amidotransferase-like domain-containing protein [Firmicutes bacterium]|nr:Type 1 glutamine amidotransferase-like domain-containing protein [Bacillota bacterium]
MENKINYLFSSVDKKNGFTEKQALCLKNDIKNNSTITFITSDFNSYEKNDEFINMILVFFKKIDIEFKKIYTIDNRTNIPSLKTIIADSDVIYITGGNPQRQIENINKFNLKKLLNNYNKIIIGVSAGAINQANKITYWDNEIITYEGLNLVNIHIYPHLDINNIDNLKEILLVSKYQRIYALPDNSFIRIQNDNIEIYGDYYVLG